MVKVAVVILNYNGVDYLRQFLPRVIQYSGDSEIWVADNASTDGSVGFLKENFPEIGCIEMAVNTGYAGGYNEAISKVNADYVVLLNSDVEVTENWIDPIIHLMESDSSIAACQPKIKSYSNKEYFEYAGAAGGYIDKYAYPFCRGRLFDSVEKDTGQYDSVEEVFWATGACLFVRVQSFEEVGGLDADFFAHMEEIDLCWRFKNRGYSIKCHPQSVVFHVGGGTLQKSNPFKTYLNFRNSLYMIVKNYPKQKLINVLLIRLLLDGVAGIKFLISAEFGNFLAILKAHLAFYQNYSSLHKKRQVEAKMPSEMYQKSIVIQNYLKGKKTFNTLEKTWS